MASKDQASLTKPFSTHNLAQFLCSAPPNPEVAEIWTNFIEFCGWKTCVSETRIHVWHNLHTFTINVSQM